jgi:hypothetical protein
MINNIDDLTLGEIKALSRFLSQLPTAPVAQSKTPAHPFKIGANYFIRTVTYHYTGKLVEVTPTELVLTDAAWIADDGRLTGALTSCEFSEVEMFPASQQVIIGRGSLVDAVKIEKLPVEQK